MNPRQLELWNNLMNLVENNEAFYYVDQQVDDVWYRIFSYRLASYTNFLLPDALECRGHMFQISEEGKAATPVRLAAWPMEKFFNKDENPLTMGLDYSNVQNIMLKVDGSLISTYLHNGTLRLKSKTSLGSDQAVSAMKYLDSDDEVYFKEELTFLVNEGYTVNLEWCSPDNRIVIGYARPHLTVLNVRNNETGEYVSFAQLHLLYGEGVLDTIGHWVGHTAQKDPVAFVTQIPTMQGVEGYVLRLNTGQHVKIKTEWYLVQHRAKDSINSPRRLYEAVLEEATDDLRSLFHDQEVIIKTIEEMELRVEQMYNHLVDVVERFYARNKHMERKDYAILGQAELDKKEFGLAMRKYIGRVVDYKEHMKKHWKECGIRDTVEEHE